MCVCVCLSSIGGQTAGPIMTKFGTNMRIDMGMVPTKYWPHEWPGSAGSLGPISESGLSCQLLLRAVVWQMTSQLIRRRNDVVFAAFNQPVSGLDIKQFGPLAQGASRFEKSLAQGPVDFASHWTTNSRHRQHAYSLRQNRSHGKSCNSVHCLL